MKEILDKVEKLYTVSLKEHGVNSEAVGWPTIDGQVLRFDILVKVIEEKNKAFTVNDLGCGYASMFEYFESNKFNLSKYTGYDISEDMLKTAQLRLENNNKVIIHKFFSFYAITF